VEKRVYKGQKVLGVKKKTLEVKEFGKVKRFWRLRGFLELNTSWTEITGRLRLGFLTFYSGTGVCVTGCELGSSLFVVLRIVGSRR
jgi:hypothetical protein